MQIALNKLLVLSWVCLFGYTTATPIFGGESVVIKDYPYQVSLRTKNYHYCGGALIDENHVLTAAHCVATPLAFYMTIHIGVSNIHENGTVRHFIRAATHPNWVQDLKNSYKHDIAILTLNESVIYNDMQQNVSLPTKKVDVGTRAVLVGWGHTAQNPIVRPEQLQKIEVVVASNEDCMKKKTALVLHDEQLCTLSTNTVGFCTGDSGGPLVFDNQVIGIVSWFDNDNITCATGDPEIYTDVYAYKGWIESEIKIDQTMYTMLN